jgi:protein-tyrosine phosphatase
LAELQGLDVVTASAGTHGYHIGAAPDPRSIEVAKRRNISMQGQTARKFSPQDFRDWDLILAMDQGHLAHLQAMNFPNSGAHVDLFMS